MGLKIALTLLALASWLHAQGPAWDAAAATAVVFNRDYPESAALAEEYARMRGIPDEQLIAVSCSKEEAISREAFLETIAEPLRGIFIERDWWKLQLRDLLEPASAKMKRVPVVVQARVSILLLMHGVPSKIIRQRENPKQAEQDEASVDSELASLGLPGVRLAGGVPNPYFNQTERFNAVPAAQGMLLVTRLDAASPATVRRMMDDAVAVEPIGLRGRAVIDLALKKGADEQGDVADGGEVSIEDLLAAQMAGRAGQDAGISYVAFTATPKAKTLELFGRVPDASKPAGQGNLPAAFHIYSMRQAIEE
ncbi:MAG: TIGR03790 family protein, partial [Roseimicrobium sp.]